MREQPRQETYSLHRYLNENGAPDYEKIFSSIETPLRRHLDPWLLKHLDNQPEIVRGYRHLKQHLEECEECNKKSR